MVGKKKGTGKKEGAGGKRGVKLSTSKKKDGSHEAKKTKLDGTASGLMPHENDVLFGRGSYTNDHNKGTMWRKLVDERKMFYHQKQDSAHKRQVAMDIINQLSRLDPPARFLAQSENKCWYAVEESHAIEKTMQKLRHDAVSVKSAVEEERFQSRLLCHENGPATAQPPQLQASYPTTTQTTSYPTTTISQTPTPFASTAPYIPLRQYQHQGGPLSLHPNASAHQVASTLPCTTTMANQALQPFMPFGAHVMPSLSRMPSQQQSLGTSLQQGLNTMVLPPSTCVEPNSSDTSSTAIIKSTRQVEDQIQKSGLPSIVDLAASLDHDQATPSLRVAVADEAKPRSNSQGSRQPENQEYAEEATVASRVTTLNRAESEFSTVEAAALGDDNMSYGEGDATTYAALRSSVDMLQQAKDILQNQSVSSQKLLEIQNQLKELNKANTMLQQETNGLRQTCERLTAQDSSLTERLERYQRYQQDWERLTAQNQALTEQNHTLIERLGRFKQGTTRSEEA